MNIVVLTFTHNDNYGASLQCYALNKYLIDRGHNVTELYVPHLHQRKKTLCDKMVHIWKAIKYRSRALILGKERALSSQAENIINPDYVRNTMTESEMIEYPVFLKNRTELFEKFYNESMISFTEPCFTEKEVKSLNLEADLYIVGSDQVWNPWITKGQKKIFFFSFLPDNAKRISYAGCFGGSGEWNESEKDTNEIKTLLHKFEGISVRSSVSKNILSNVFDVKSELVLDPSFLLDECDYKKIADKSDLNGEGCLFLNKFYINDKWLDAFRGFSEKRGLKLTANGEYLHLKGVNYEPLLPVEGWLKIISTADFVITDSFHCTVFCVIFRKQFITTPSYPKGEGRMIAFLDELGLGDRYFCSSEDFVNNYQRCEVQIDYDKVYSILSEKEKLSKDFLNSYLS